MAEIMEKDKVTMNEEISTVENACTELVLGEDVKEESTENQGIVKHFTNIYIYLFIFIFMIFEVFILKFKLLNLKSLAVIDISKNKTKRYPVKKYSLNMSILV